MRALLLLCFTCAVIIHTGCGASQKSLGEYSGPSDEAADDPWGTPSQPVSARAQQSSRHSSRQSTQLQREMPEFDSPQSTPAGEHEPAPTAQPQPPSRKVVYTGYLKLRVRHLLDAQKKLTAITQKRGGYLESMTRTHMVVRIPASDFKTVLDELAGVGETLGRSIRATDVTDAFTDMTARLRVAKEARERLLALLELTKDTKERLRILSEVQRLTEQIETVEASLTTLKNLIDYYTITIELVPVRDSASAPPHLSPFPWVAQLSPYLGPHSGNTNPFILTLPKGFFLLEDADRWEARSADTTVINGDVIDNEPRGDVEFWIEAIKHEMDGRNERLVESRTSGPMNYLLYLNDDVENRYYMIALHIIEDEIFVIEAFFPNEKSYKRHFAAIAESLETFEAK